MRFINICIIIIIIISYGSTNTSAAVLYCYPVCYDNILVMKTDDYDDDDEDDVLRGTEEV